MSRRGTLVDGLVTDNTAHYGTSPGGYTGAGEGYPNEGPFYGLGPLRDADDLEWINVGTETSITIDVVNSLNQTVTVEVEGFTTGDLSDDGDWTNIDTMVVTAGSTDQSVIDLTDDNWNKVRVRYTYSSAPSGGGSSNEQQTINFGNASTQSAAMVPTGQFNDFDFLTATPNPSTLPTEMWQSMPIGRKGDQIDVIRSNGANQTGSAIDLPYGDPLRPSFTLTFGGQTTSRIEWDQDITTDIQAALNALSNIDPGDAVVTRTNNLVYVVDFAGQYAGQDVGPITITNTLSFTPTGVTVTDQGGDTLSITWEASRGEDAFSGIPVGT